MWSTDITYIRLARGFVYLTAVIDWYSRNVLAWRLSNTLDSEFCVDCLEQSIRSYGTPEIFNTDQGCQFTSEAFTGVLKLHDIAISMDGRGRALDNIFVERLWRSVKHEDVYLKGYVNMPDLQLGLTEYFEFYNTERPHQSLGDLTPIQAYQTACGGGARIVDKFKEQKTFLEVEPESKVETTILNPKDYCLDQWVHFIGVELPDSYIDRARVDRIRINLSNRLCQQDFPVKGAVYAGQRKHISPFNSYSDCR